MFLATLYSILYNLSLSRKMFIKMKGRSVFHLESYLKIYLCSQMWPDCARDQFFLSMRNNLIRFVTLVYDGSRKYRVRKLSTILRDMTDIGRRRKHFCEIRESLPKNASCMNCLPCYLRYRELFALSE